MANQRNLDELLEEAKKLCDKSIELCVADRLLELVKVELAAFDFSDDDMLTEKTQE